MPSLGELFINKLKSIKSDIIGLIQEKKIILAGIPESGVHVFYGHDTLPDSKEIAKGGMIKLQRLNRYFPNTSYRFNVLYMVSSNLSPYAEKYLKPAKQKGAVFIWNQNGVAYPAWMNSGWEAFNARMAVFLNDADYVFYQSEFAKESSDQFLGKRSGPSEILYNAVDTTVFCPAKYKKAPNQLTLLVIGSQYHNYPLESAFKTLSCIKQVRPQTRMIVAGKIHNHVLESVRHLIVDLQLKDSIEFLPPFTQKQAVEIYRRADILLHTKIQDVCPGVVIEAMACGVPVVYSNSGGVPELVGEEAGFGVVTETTWEKRIPPMPEAWAEAVSAVLDSYPDYAEAARQRAAERFDLQPWIERHKQIFEKLL